MGFDPFYVVTLNSENEYSIAARCVVATRSAAMVTRRVRWILPSLVLLLVDSSMSSVSFGCRLKLEATKIIKVSVAYPEN